jgi:hypothetical protein
MGMNLHFDAGTRFAFFVLSGLAHPALLIIDSCDVGEETYVQKQREVSYEAKCD